MSFEYAYRVWQTEPPSSLRDLDDVVLLVDAITDDGTTIHAGTEGTIVSVHGDGESYVVEFSEPVGALVTALPHHLQVADRSDIER
ncbi:DUF4926 domain-containing protein [Methylobacterium sp. WL2]|uniref:DUF4926 domain-containing protein n=1 Tax=Methylobacterium sp. WL2 TaxID=2603902 RepID=UPI0011CA10EF|nr:DUF4926 domain-containing protein [Methylobacterium sp. WL2]TXN51620.1 DUF4926 domain-containing protein [Methylobacterium sp. WL2]